MKNIILPDIKFMPFKVGTTEKDLIEYMATHYEESIFLVHLRWDMKMKNNGDILRMHVACVILMTFYGYMIGTKDNNMLNI